MSQHPSPSEQPVKGPDDLERDPGIGQSPGMRGVEDPDLRELQGENTVEGDVENDSSLGGGVDPDQRGRDH